MSKKKTKPSPAGDDTSVLGSFQPALGLALVPEALDEVPDHEAGMVEVTVRTGRPAGLWDLSSELEDPTRPDRPLRPGPAFPRRRIRSPFALGAAVARVPRDLIQTRVAKPRRRAADVLPPDGSEQDPTEEYIAEDISSDRQVPLRRSMESSVVRLSGASLEYFRSLEQDARTTARADPVALPPLVQPRTQPGALLSILLGLGLGLALALVGGAFLLLLAM